VCTCIEGYRPSIDGLICEDINECILEGCSKHAYCQNTEGSFECFCQPGYSGDGLTSCTAIGVTSEPEEYEPNSYLECDGLLECGPHADCRPRDDANDECRCHVGYEGNPYDKTIGCEDINECSNMVRNVTCAANAYCENTDGSWQCNCMKGYNGDPVKDGCAKEKLTCDGEPALRCGPNTRCLSGGVVRDDECNCLSGFNGDPYDLNNGCQELGTGRPEVTTPGKNNPCFVGNPEVAYCKNGGKCFPTLLYRPFCLCRPQYTGTRCQDKKEITRPGRFTTASTSTTEEGKVTRPGIFTTRPEQTTTMEPFTTAESAVGTDRPELSTTPNKRDPCFIGDSELPFCKNGGKCYTTLFLNRPQCICPLRYTGDRCQDIKEFTRPGIFTTEPTTTTEADIILDPVAIRFIEKLIDRKVNELKEEVDGEIEAIQENIYEQEEDITDVEEKIVELKFISAEEKRCQGVLIDGSCFFLGKHQYDFDTSVLDCRKDGAELARISNLRTFTAVHSYMLNADHITDKSGLFAWTGLANEDNDEESADQQEWLSGMFSGTGFPEAKVMWQVMSDLYFSKQDGFVYAPKEATGYPLCAYEIRSFPEGPTTTTEEPMRPTRSTEEPMRPTIIPVRSTTTNKTPARPTKPLDPLRPTRNPNITERSSSLDQDPYVSCPRGEKECDSETICTD